MSIMTFIGGQELAHLERAEDHTRKLAEEFSKLELMCLALFKLNSRRSRHRNDNGMDMHIIFAM